MVNNLLVDETIPRFYLTLHPGTFPTKESFELGKITNWFKKYGLSKRFTIEEIFKFSTEARCYIASHIETDGKQYEFVSSQLLFLDVDDDECVTDPQRVLEQLKDICAGLFYTSSHGIKGNRYRLCFILDNAVRDTRHYMDIFVQLTKRLNHIGIPADTNTQDGLQRIRTSTNGYILSNPNARLNVNEYLQLAQKEREKEFEAKKNKLIDFADRKEYRSYSFEELKERASIIGYVSEYKEWERLAYSLKSYAEEGHITDEQAYEVFSILCGGNDETKYWEGLKPRGITIGSFIHASNEKGFKSNFRYYHAVSDKVHSKIPIECYKFDRHITSSFAYEILTREEKTLVKAPTGSGKTTSFLDGAKAFALTKEKPSRFFLFAVPTVAICQQIVADHDGVLGIWGERGDIFKAIKEYQNDNGRVIACTYDMAKPITELIKKINPFATFTIMIDEYHQFVHGFKYRRAAIESLYALRYNARGFIGLSGTIDDILKNDFDKEIHIETKNSAAPCRMWGAITYSKMKDEEVSLIQLLKQKATSGKKLLVFIQNKDMIQKVYRALSVIQISVRTITSDGKKGNKTYTHIVETSTFPEDVQVILTTTVLSDGVNINNDNVNYECIVVTSKKSPIFNVSLVRQMSNRFRNTYNAFYLFMLDARKDTKYHYNIEQAHQYEKGLAEKSVELLTQEFNHKDDIRLYRAAKLERKYGIEFINGVPTFSELHIRHNVSVEKSDFYGVFRNKFIEACSTLLEIKPSPSINISNYLETTRVDVSDIERTIIELQQVEIIGRQQLIENLAIYYSAIVHQAMKEGNEGVIKEFKRVSTPEHFSCLENISKFTEYETALKIAKKITRPNDTYAFKNRFNALLDIMYFSAIHRTTPTRSLFKAVSKLVDKQLTKSEIKEYAKKIAKKSKMAKVADVEHVINYYFTHEHTRTKHERFTTLKTLTAEDLIQEFDLSSKEFYFIMHNLIQKEDELKKQILLNSIAN